MKLRIVDKSVMNDLELDSVVFSNSKAALIMMKAGDSKLFFPPRGRQ